MHGTPCWFELDTTDLDAGAAFYGQILGWQVAHSGMPDADYRLASAPDGAMVADLSSTDEQEQASPKWVVYFAVDDADANLCDGCVTVVACGARRGAGDRGGGGRDGHGARVFAHVQDPFVGLRRATGGSSARGPACDARTRLVTPR